MRGKTVLMVLLAVVAIGGGLVVGMRIARGKVSLTVGIKPGMNGVKSAGGFYSYGARVSGGVILFDTGADPQGQPVDGLLSSLGAGRSDVRAIFLTHGHFDHVAGAGAFAGGATGVALPLPIYLGAADVGLAAGTDPPEGMLGKLLTMAMRPEPVKISNLLTGPQSIAVGTDQVVKAFPVPGHTPGSFAFLYDGVLFVGDIVIFKEGRLQPTPAVFDPHPEENRAAIRSLKTQLVAETFETICTGHGGCTPKGLARNLLDELITRLGT